MDRLRQAKLKKKFGALYPEIPADHWIPAWLAVTRRAHRVWSERGADAMIEDRLLPDEHFEFRGGIPRAPTWSAAPERLSDHRPADGRLQDR